MNLIIDIGNTKGKIAVFDHDKIIQIDSFNTVNIIEAIGNFIDKNKILKYFFSLILHLSLSLGVSIL